MTLLIESARVNDAGEILALQKLAYRSEAEIYSDFNIPSMVQTMEEMKQDFKNQIYLKGVIDGKIVGSVRAFSEKGTCHIGRLIVHPEFQNQGIGTELMKEIEQRFHTCRRYELFTGDRSEKNLHLYEKLGYRRFKTAPVTDRTTIVFLEKVMEPGRGEGQE